MERAISSFSIQRLAASPFRNNGKWTLAICSSSNLITFLRNYDEVSFIYHQSLSVIFDLLLYSWLIIFRQMQLSGKVKIQY